MQVRDWQPSPEDVGAVIRARTINELGNELGTFTDATRPTRGELLPLIDSVVQRISVRAGNIPDSLQAYARRIAAMGVACQVELSFFPEQITSGHSNYPQLLESFNEGFNELITASQTDDGDETTGDIEALASHSFPVDCDSVGLSSMW